MQLSLCRADERSSGGPEVPGSCADAGTQTRIGFHLWYPLLIPWSDNFSTRSIKLVLAAGLEPACLSTAEPKSAASARFAMRAMVPQTGLEPVRITPRFLRPLRIPIPPPRQSWYRRQDSNLHGLLQSILSRQCIPIPTTPACIWSVQQDLNLRNLLRPRQAT